MTRRRMVPLRVRIGGVPFRLRRRSLRLAHLAVRPIERRYYGTSYAPDSPWSEAELVAAHRAWVDLQEAANGGPIVRDSPMELLEVETILSAAAEQRARGC